ncbi:TetR/AcrR family transcriptional regulator [Paenibacillus motobuensis]|uniref:TetR/AcrR family transcriptional regulator n=2 Tax=Paenibacillus motobuensis TaxID=295324 RepID=A0ABN0YEE0_9BACL
MESSRDRRVIRTKAIIRTAFTNLIEEKGFDALTVKDITTRAEINRGTFYLHYRDKYDLLEQNEQELIQGLIGILSTMQPVIDIEQVLPQIVRVFEYLGEHADFLKTILGPKGDPSFHALLRKMMSEHLFEKNVVPFIRKENALVPINYLVSYIASAHFGIIQEWLMQGRQESPQEIASIIFKLSALGPLYAAGVVKDSKQVTDRR